MFIFFKAKVECIKEAVATECNFLTYLYLSCKNNVIRYDTTLIYFFVSGFFFALPQGLHLILRTFVTHRNMRGIKYEHFS